MIDVATTPQPPVDATGTWRIRFAAMGGSGEVVLAAAGAAQARRCADAAIAEVLRIEHKYSRYRADSVVSRINAAAGRADVACDSETLALLDYAHTLFGASGGLFDVTSGVLRRAWRFGPDAQGRPPQPPDAAALEPLLALVGWPRVQRDGARVFLPEPGMELDLGGFGKEYAADRAVAVLVAQGVTHGHVNLGGDLAVVGPRADGRPWSIGIRDPRRADALMASVPVSRGGLATSGDYERWFEHNGQRFCHVLDPVRGVPVRHWRSVSVLAPSALAAGTVSTIAMLMQHDGLRFLDDSGHDYLAVDAEGRLHQRAAGAPQAVQPGKCAH